MNSGVAMADILTGLLQNQAILAAFLDAKPAASASTSISPSSMFRSLRSPIRLPLT